MDGIEMMGSNFGDMTFAPTSCSTQNFTAAARLASTPFNSLGVMGPLPVPPLRYDLSYSTVTFVYVYYNIMFDKIYIVNTV